MKLAPRALAALLSCALCALLCAPSALALDRPALDAALSGAAARVLAAAPAPQVGTVGGEWAVLGLARSGAPVPQGYYQAYLTGVTEYVSARAGILHDRKYTEYSRVILALSALGADARDVAGYDLTLPLGDFDKTVWQGINGPIWALIALDARDYPMPQNPAAKTPATRQRYVDHILSLQNVDGGWSLSGGAVSDPDITGMALQALAKYRDQPAVESAVQSALSCMSARQGADGGFASWGVENSESCVQMLAALCELGISLDDARFVKDGRTLLDGLLVFRTSSGGFLHTIPAGGSDEMATEQALYALAAVRRMEDGETSLYRMGDAAPLPSSAASPANRDPSVHVLPVTHPGVTFADLSGYPARTAVEALAARGVVTGRSAAAFDPDGAVTRAELAALVVRALGLPARTGEPFTDVPPAAWYASAVSASSAYGILSGRGGGVFAPLELVTRQEAAVIAANAAKLCGLDTAADQRVLTQFPDRTDAAQWARPALAFCYASGLLDQADAHIRPQAPATRGETAQLLYHLLSAAGLL